MDYIIGFIIAILAIQAAEKYLKIKVPFGGIFKALFAIISFPFKLFTKPFNNAMKVRYKEWLKYRGKIEKDRYDANYRNRRRRGP